MTDLILPLLLFICFCICLHACLSVRPWKALLHFRWININLTISSCCWCAALGRWRAVEDGIYTVSNHRAWGMGIEEAWPNIIIIPFWVIKNALIRSATRLWGDRRPLIRPNPVEYILIRYQSGNHQQSSSALLESEVSSSASCLLISQNLSTDLMRCPQQSPIWERRDSREPGNATPEPIPTSDSIFELDDGRRIRIMEIFTR